MSSLLSLMKLHLLNHGPFCCLCVDYMFKVEYKDTRVTYDAILVSKPSTLKTSHESSVFIVNPLSANPTKWSNTQNNSSAVADELFECLLILWSWRVKG